MDEKSLTVSFDEKAEQKARNLNFAQLTKEEGQRKQNSFTLSRWFYTTTNTPFLLSCFVVRLVRHQNHIK